MKTTILSSVLLLASASSAFARTLPLPKANVIPGKVPLIIAEKADDFDESCVIYTELTLESTGENQGTATLVNKVGGECELYVAPNKRVYDIDAVNDGCGSRLYRTTDRSFPYITIADHRQRLCDDYRPHHVTAVETLNAQVELRYVSLEL